MKLNRLILIFSLVSLVAVAREDKLSRQHHRIDIPEYEIMVSQVQDIIDTLAELSKNRLIQPYIDRMNLAANKVNVVNFSCLCTVIDWSLKDFKKIFSLYPHAVIYKKLLESIDEDKLELVMLQAMQRDSRQLVKDIIAQYKHRQTTDSLTSSLQELYHALHEYKKQIATIDKVPSIKAWYIYITLLFLDVTLMQGISALDFCEKNRLEQQMIKQQLTCMIERFKYSMVSDF